MSMSSPLTIVLVIWAAVVGVYLLLIFVGSFMNLREEDTLYLSAGESKMAAAQSEVQARINRLEPIRRWFAYGSLAMTVILAGTWITGVVHELMR